MVRPLLHERLTLNYDLVSDHERILDILPFFSIGVVYCNDTRLCRANGQPCEAAVFTASGNLISRWQVNFALARQKKRLHMHMAKTRIEHATFGCFCLFLS